MVGTSPCVSLTRGSDGLDASKENVSLCRALGVDVTASAVSLAVILAGAGSSPGACPTPTQPSFSLLETEVRTRASPLHPFDPRDPRLWVRFSSAFLVPNPRLNRPKSSSTRVTFGGPFGVLFVFVFANLCRRWRFRLKRGSPPTEPLTRFLS
ncbi:hypothetical protein PPTG_01296 [Phytophthora nicotianae INRA-310]|uniref:Uncharacterized protein n=1 Tax=Phytophthora nicotianae (strain INRA-310) TaxID=761204 RepID=W2R8C0_PHYN3|nr:hypothetical protein PPTG_01296 [Phytophthora nicotianae INRA-310]ETN20944.1 hypothetical protein PPTG_01296 [Phytophthora nicotianae INRA-310]